MKRALPYLALALVVIGFVNFFWFMAESSRLGGDALNGYQEDGHYYVSRYPHGAGREVSQSDWERSRIHAISVPVTHPLAMLGMGYLLFTVVFPAMTGMRNGKVSGLSGRSSVELGPVLASARTWGRVGNLSLSWPLLAVSVFQDAVLVHPIFMPKVIIKGSEITRIGIDTKAFSAGIRVDHVSPEAVSPLVLGESPKGPVARAIEAMTGMTFLPQTGLAQPLEQQRVEPREAGVPPGEEEFPLVMKLLVIFGLLTSFGMILFGFIWVVPALNFPGILWVVISLGITLANCYLWLFKYRHRWKHGSQ